MCLSFVLFAVALPLPLWGKPKVYAFWKVWKLGASTLFFFFAGGSSIWACFSFARHRGGACKTASFLTECGCKV